MIHTPLFFRANGGGGERATSQTMIHRTYARLRTTRHPIPHCQPSHVVVTFDLAGLPVTMGELDVNSSDVTQDAYGEMGDEGAGTALAPPTNLLPEPRPPPTTAAATPPQRRRQHVESAATPTQQHPANEQMGTRMNRHRTWTRCAPYS